MAYTIIMDNPMLGFLVFLNPALDILHVMGQVMEGQILYSSQ